MKTYNTYGRTFVTDYDGELEKVEENFTGSSLCRKKAKDKPRNEFLTVKEAIERQEKRKNKTKPEPELKSMSRRTKQKVQDKLMAFSRQFHNLTFVTLTFANAVTDLIAVDILRRFLDNAKKRQNGFEYLWVAERQTKNKTFKDNIHFHMVTNVSWDIKKFWQYWLDVQRKNGIVPTNPDYSPSSAFNVKKIKQNDLKKLQNYLTKYVSKNKDEFKCQVWNCSKGISRLYTHVTGTGEILENAYRLEPETINEYYTEYGTSHFIPLNQKTIRLYHKLDAINETTMRPNA